jgi:hypothetical protein
LNKDILRRVISSQIVLKEIPQIIQLKLNLFSEQKDNKPLVETPNQHTFPKEKEKINQKLYCGGIVLYYLQQKQPQRYQHLRRENNRKLRKKTNTTK